MADLILRTNSIGTATGIVEDDYSISVPMIAVIAGKLKGDNLPLAELVKSVKAWNGIPVSFRHPKQTNGQNDVIQNAPEMIVGKLSAVEIKDKALHAVATFRKNVTPLVDSIIANIKAGLQYEVSTGYLAQMDGNNHVDIRPDHLAILPDETGACSWTQGCGLPRQNSQEGEEDMTQEEIQTLIDAALQSADPTAALTATNEAIAALSTTVEGLAASVVANAEAIGEGADEEGEDDAGDAFVMPVEVTALIESLQALGGAEGITAALGALKANSDEQRTALITEIKANASNFTDDELAALDNEMLAKIATTVRPASFVFGRSPANVANAAEWEDYDAA